MIIKHNEDECKFTLFGDDGQEVGCIVYRVGAKDELRATHTEVNPAYGNRGYAGVLVDALVEYAESCNAVIVPVCSYVRQKFDKNPARYASVRK